MSLQSQPGEDVVREVPADVSRFSFAISRALGKVVVTLHGDLDDASSATLAGVLRDLIVGQGNLAVAVDARDVALAAPEALSVLHSAAGWAHGQDGELTVHGPPHLYQALETTRLTGVENATCRSSGRLHLVAPTTADPHGQGAARCHPASRTNATREARP